jgi:hypothetical protein
MVSPPSNSNNNMVQPSSIFPTNPDNVRSFRENNRIINLNQNDNSVQNNIANIDNINLPNTPIDLNLVIYTTSDAGDVERIWRFQENVILPRRGPLPIHLT